MKNRNTIVVNLPFPGFYESPYSDAINREESYYGESLCSGYASDGETAFPEALRLDESDLAGLLYRVSNYRDAYQQLARDYVESFDAYAGELFGFSVADARTTWRNGNKESEPYQRDSISMVFESMDSPREYNFATDRVYGEMPLAILYLLFRKSRAEGHETLAAVIAERFTSYDGFISGYSRDIGDWLEKPLRDYDHNEAGTLLIAAMRLAGYDESSFEYDLFEMTCGDSETAYSAWSDCVDWPKFEELRNEARAEKLADWLESDMDSALIWRANHAELFAELAPDFDAPADAPYRCTETPDLFTHA